MGRRVAAVVKGGKLSKDFWIWLGVGLIPLSIYALGGLLLSMGAITKVFGALLAAFFPGIWLIAPVARRFSKDQPWDGVPALWWAFVFSVIAHALNITVLKILGIEVHGPLVLALASLEGGLALFWARKTLPTLVPPSRQGLLALGILSIALGSWALSQSANLLRDLDRYWYDATPMAGTYEGIDLEAQGLKFSPEGRELTGERGELRLEGPGTSALSLRYAFLLNGPIGAQLTVECAGTKHQSTVEKDIQEVVEEGRVPRYHRRGIASLFFEAQAGDAPCKWAISGGDGATYLYHFSGAPDWVFWDSDHDQGLRLTHYYQLLNIVENIRWAEELRSTRWLTIHQPPLWSYVYSAVVLYAGPSLLACHLYFLLLLFCLGALSFRILRELDPRVSGLFMLPIALLTVSHGKIILSSCSANFPDNLYALTVVVMILGLARKELALFISGALFASFLRYPGSTVALLAILSLLVFDRPKREIAWMALKRFGGALLIPCLLLGAGALFTGLLEEWLEILWFETFPEHFHGDYSWASLSPRPREFYTLWATYSGGLLLLLPLAKGGIPRAAGLLAVVYSFFLCFIDHFPTHYFLPLLALSAIAIAGGFAKYRSPLKWVGLSVATIGPLIWVLWGQV